MRHHSPDVDSVIESVKPFTQALQVQLPLGVVVQAPLVVQCACMPPVAYTVRCDELKLKLGNLFFCYLMEFSLEEVENKDKLVLMVFYIL
jgi:hypothetical protein